MGPKLTFQVLAGLLLALNTAFASSQESVGDYVSLADTELHFNTADVKQNKWRPRFQAVLDIPRWAVRDAVSAQGRYPVVIYAPSDSATAWENADLCKYLASNGYVVLASPSLGASTRDLTDDIEGINAEAKDISFLITYASGLPQAEASKVAVVSWSGEGRFATQRFGINPDPAALAGILQEPSTLQGTYASSASQVFPSFRHSPDL